MEHLSNQNISTYWSLGGLLAFVLTKDVAEAQKWHDDNDSAVIVGMLVSSKTFKRTPPGQNDDSSKVDTEVSEALESVLHSLMNGSLRSKAIKPLRGPRVDLSPEEWVGRTFVFATEQGDAADDVEYLGKLEHRWSHLLFSSLDAREIWGAAPPVSEEPAPIGATANTVALNENLFVESGSVFEIAFEGERFHLKKSVGLGYINHLISHPSQSIDALDLRTIVNPPDLELIDQELTTYSSHELEGEGLNIGSWGEGGTKFDEQTKRQIETAIKSCQRDYDIAKETGDVGLQSELQERLALLESYHSGGVDIHGNLRKENSELENNRKAIGKAITAAIKNIQEFSPALADHFDQAILKGKSLSYSPQNPITWKSKS